MINARRLAVSAAFLLTASTIPASAITVTADFDNLTPVRGMGSGLNKYGWSMLAPSDGALYVGSFSVNMDYMALPHYLGQIAAADEPLPAITDGFRRMWLGSPATHSDGGAIYRYDGANWTEVLKTGPEEVGFRAMEEFKGTIFAATANGPNGPEHGEGPYEVGTNVIYDPARDGTKLYSSTDGTTWSEVDGGPFDDVYNTSVRTMKVIGDKMYVGTENQVTGGQLWSFDGTTWKLEAELNEGGTPRGIAVSEVAEFQGKPVFGTWISGGDSGFGIEVLQLQDDGTLVDLTPKFSDPDVFDAVSGVMELREFDGELYVGTLGYAGGFALVRSGDPANAGIDDWEVVTGDGFGSEFPGQGGTSANAYPWSSVVIDGIYYIGTFQTNATDSWLDQAVGTDVPMDGRGQIWYSEDGKTWHILEDNGFDSPFTYGVRELTEWNGKLVAATASNMFVPDFLSDPYLSLLASRGELTRDSFEAWLAQYAPEQPDFLMSLFDRGLIGTDGWKSPYIGFEVYAADVAPVPLPASALLLLGGVAGLGGLRFRSRRNGRPANA